MAFSRNFRSQTWMFQLRSGELEVASGEVLEASFRYGVLDAMTPVRAVGGHVWERLADVADLHPPPDAPLSSLAPLAMASTPPPDLDESHVVRFGNYVDGTFEKTVSASARRRRALISAAALAVAAFGLVASGGMLEREGRAFGASSRSSMRLGASPAAFAPAPVGPLPTASAEAPQRASVDPPSVSAEASPVPALSPVPARAGGKRLDEATAQRLHAAHPKKKRRGQGRTSRTPIEAPPSAGASVGRAQPQGAAPPSREWLEARRFDPLDGTL